MRAVVLSGGLTHDFPATTARLAALLETEGLDVDVHTGVAGVESALHALPGAALLVVNALRWSMTGEGTPPRYREQAGAEGASPSSAARDALDAHLAAGGGVLGMHTASICFDDWPGWGATLGGAWEWGRSQHPPLGPEVTVSVAAEHPLVSGLDPFTLVDEVYGDLRYSGDVTGLLTAPQPGSGAVQPLLWAREHGGGRVVYDALGHHPPSYDVPEHAEVVRRAVRWTTAG
ncbi:ThuA domain-containing protein [Pseudonocardia sp. KRD-184]|uniref:ThuA domain-containing protein n=1 Tax=Pseudonocardia oceani TaxID=2792013 RepID=A0ABS6U1T8_9PSEU|nr:ThuA domain-containing protein [Pseudonocardia oceani]MBW0089401.1 ThuA domain-containing protein [Pseudonocardia oceani]MBW0096407.1 ThuA domain-containing protein [Pseudonocardia oceani]MBW0109143.1 ThuA domain-containing protein [Pseudonocardia oceani]MBW0122408.1 ThuA domain-containing protein [Pseudonocardia oceani]MBW0126207.1 ThuA domain-containing protein [Pseudonocardia oceani]